MVVLETGDIMSSGDTRYNNTPLPPDYVPHPPDSKISPLVLLAQTCSQIGADNPPSKPLLTTMDKPKKSSTGERTSPSSKGEQTKPAYRPYEITVLTHSPSSKGQDTPEDKRKTPSRKTVSPIEKCSSTPVASSSPVKSVSPSEGASPTVRPATEVLQGLSKDIPGNFKHSLLVPPGMDPNHPAFRGLSYLPYTTHAAALSLPSNYSTPPVPYVSYARVKTAAGGEALVPVCKDPYCTTCQVGTHLMGGGACPGGCTQCDHQKYYLAAAAAAAAIGFVPPPPVLASAYHARPYSCSWTADGYCGKRFASAEELMQHLRAHSAPTEPSSLLNPLRYPNPPLSPLSAARYYPYPKPGMPTSPVSPYSAFNPTLGPWYSSYVYGQKLPAASVHP